MGATFFKSKSVNIFPCARRGTYKEAGNDKDRIYNPESRFVSEANLTKLSGLAFGRDSYIISRPSAVSEGGIWKLFIKGYYFELTIEKDELQEEGYFIIGLEDASEISRIRLAALESSGSLISINKGATSLDADGRCRAICFISSDEEPSGDALYYVHSEDTLENLDKSYAKSESVDARLDIIEGKGEGSVEKALVDAKEYADGLASNYDAAGAAADVRTYVDGTFKATIEGYADGKVDALAKGQVNTNKEAIEDLKNAISGSGTPGGSVDTSITSRVTRAEGKITSLEETIGTLEVRVDDAQTRVGAVETRAKTLEDIVDGYAATNDDPYKTVKAHVEAVSVRADTAQADINTLGVVVNGKAESTEGAGDSVVGLVDKVEVLEATIGNAGSGLVKDVAANAEAIDTLVGSEEGDDTKSVRTIVAEETNEIREAITDLQANYLSKTDVEGGIRGIYAVAFDLSKYSGNLEDLSSDFKEAISRPIVFISGCSMLPSPPEGYAWFNSLNDDAIKVETIDTNIILYLKEISSPEEDPESPPTT